MKKALVVSIILMVFVGFMSWRHSENLADEEDDADRWDSGLFVICSPRLGIFDIRLTSNEEPSLAALADGERTRLIFPGDNVASTDCKLNEGVLVTVKYRDTPGHVGRCGVVWQPAVSIWVNGRNVIRKEFLAESWCQGQPLQSVTLRDGVIKSCRIESGDNGEGIQDCLSSPLADVLAATPDPTFAPTAAAAGPTDRFILIEGKEDSLCKAIFQRWSINEDDPLEDLLDPSLTWMPIPMRDHMIIGDYAFTMTDLDGDGKDEVVARYSHESYADSGDRFVIAWNKDAVLSQAGDDIWLLDQSLNKLQIPHLLINAEPLFPTAHYEIQIMKKGEDGTRPLLITYTYEVLYRSWGTEIMPTKIVTGVDKALSLNIRCKIGPNLRKEERL